MKKVLFKKWIPRELVKEEGASISVPVPGTGCYEKDFTQEGVFLDWGIEYVDNGTGATFTVALVMLSDGTVEKVCVENIKFIL